MGLKVRLKRVQKLSMNLLFVFPFFSLMSHKGREAIKYSDRRVPYMITLLSGSRQGWYFH